MDKLEERLLKLEKRQEGFFYRKSISLGLLTWFFILYTLYCLYDTMNIHETIARFVNIFFFSTLIRDFFVATFQKKYFVKEWKYFLKNIFY